MARRCGGPDAGMRTALRALLARPGFTVIAVVTLALGIGANTAVYTVVHAVLLAPLPYADQREVVVLNEISPQFPNPISVSWQNYVDWRDRSTTFEALAAFRTTQMTLTGIGEPERVPARMVTASLLPTLGVELAVGRLFAASDDQPGAPGVAIVSDGFRRRKFGAAQEILGRSIQLDKQPYTVIGVLPPNFELFQAADVYLPIEPWAATLPDDRGWHPGILPVTRLRDGVTLSVMSVTAPPDAAMRFNLPCEKNATCSRSGDQNGSLASVVPVSGCALVEASARTHNCRWPVASAAMNASRSPSGGRPDAFHRVGSSPGPRPMPVPPPPRPLR